LLAAEASECAAEQGAFWEYHDYVFDNQSKYPLYEEYLKQHASALGLDTTAFNECLDTHKYQEVVVQDWRLARELGFRSTPSFLVNGKQFIGAQPYEAFEELIESFLSK
jgi:protein-disulfide isomerase